MRLVNKGGVLALVLALAAPAVAGAGLPPLRENDYINDRLLVAAIGDEIRNQCERIRERRVVSRSEALRLLSYTLNLGYDRRTIEAYLRDPDNRAWMDGRRDAWLEANGARPGDAESYCRIGEREIARGTLLGRLMRVE